MRTAFIQTLSRLAKADERIWLVCGDLGFSVLEDFAREFPRRYLNAGVAEQNMTGMAAGLAMTGKIVFTYSIANFPVMRCLEQIRNDVCYHRQNVKIVAVGGGYCYGAQGYTHHGVEDLGVLRLLPHMSVLAPADPVETQWATQAVVEHEGPCYIRLGRGGEPAIHPATQEFRWGKAVEMRSGGDVLLLSCGAVLGLVMAAADELARQGISARVMSVHTICPLDRDAIRMAANACGRVLTIEEHGLGGLGTVVAEALAESGVRATFRPMRLDREPLQVAGSQAYLRGLAGLSVEAIVKTARQMG